MVRGHAIRGASRRFAGVAAASLLISVLVNVFLAAPANAVVFSNSTTITIPAGAPGTTSGPATPYPSNVSVSGPTGTITDVNVTLNGLSHTFGDDIDIIVVAPNGDDVVLWTGSCGGPIGSGTYTFDQSAGSTLSDGGPCSPGTYRPSSNGGDNFNGPAPAPTPPYSTSLNTFNGDPAGGTWSLYVFDDLAVDVGSISGGWSLDITFTGPMITGFNPTSGGPGTSVQITGHNFTGATSVTFGGALAAFTVNSSTQITATVPNNAVTGPIAVTTAFGTSTSTSNFTVIPAPTITSFSPTSGRVGAAVVINGTTFTGATSVTFNGVAAAFTVTSATQISTTVPAGASTGPIAVTTASGTGTSSSSFVVKHAREVSLHFSVARGDVTVVDGFNECRDGVRVKLQHRVNGRWRTVASGSTNPNGSYNLGNQTDPGKYRTLATKFTTPSGDVCLKKKSPAVTL